VRHALPKRHCLVGPQTGRTDGTRRESSKPLFAGPTISSRPAFKGTATCPSWNLPSSGRSPSSTARSSASSCGSRERKSTERYSGSRRRRVRRSSVVHAPVIFGLGLNYCATAGANGKGCGGEWDGCDAGRLPGLLLYNRRAVTAIEPSSTRHVARVAWEGNDAPADRTHHGHPPRAGRRR